MLDRTTLDPKTPVFVVF